MAGTGVPTSPPTALQLSGQGRPSSEILPEVPEFPQSQFWVAQTLLAGGEQRVGAVGAPPGLCPVPSLSSELCWRKMKKQKNPPGAWQRSSCEAGSQDHCRRKTLSSHLALNRIESFIKSKIRAKNKLFSPVPIALPILECLEAQPILS